MEEYTIKPIGEIETPFKHKEQSPRQPGYSGGAEGTIKIYKPYIKGLEGLERYKYIIVLFYFNRINDYRLTAIPPSSNSSRGVFASRSPYRPNHIGLSVVELLRIDNNLLKVRNVDMLDGTPVIDIKPYIDEPDKNRL
ncbi:MAG: tRNA (N6-threonylcarbamoyladenosine(37)-N6)-methyltransferase TrmO [Actinomycetota bacterium]|nr:tRNA (N6-threonylcarbamoyladenosine(37)-N6)-methyltransferase TrmO [Actinomycetota bacterium]